MERIFKVKTKSNVDPRDQYPSERRYSASIVIGLSVVFFQLFLYAILMGTLIIHKLSTQQQENEMAENTDNFLNSSFGDTTMENSTEELGSNTENPSQRLYERLEKDMHGHNDHYYINIPALVCAGCFVMALGFICSFITGILAWKRWYIDHNITLFFLASSFSSLTSAICLLLSGLITLNTNFNLNEYESPTSPVTFSLAMNIIILSSIGLIWSFLSTKVAYKGMKNGYPDDVDMSKGGRTVQVNTVRKGSKNCTTFPPDIISHFPAGEKLAKYVPKHDNSNLPKAESNYEYQQRVDKFLSGSPENNDQVK